MKRRLLGAVGLVAGAAVAFAAGAFVLSDSGAEESGETESATEGPIELTTAAVEQKDLVDVTELDGTLGFGDPIALPNRASGVLTWLPEPGMIVSPGDVLYMVDEIPVVYIPGEIPAYRALEDDAEGTDVLQLESYLDSLGLMEQNDATVDGVYSSFTEDAVESWYEETFGITERVSVDDGLVVFGIDSFRISEVTGQVGDTTMGGSVISYTATTRLVTVQLDTALAGLLVEGDEVAVELPDETEVPATVSFVADIVTTSGQGPTAESWIDVELVLEGAGSAFDESPVVVSVEELVELDATVVPIPALLALTEGGYAVEKMVDESPVLVAVEIGNFLANEVSVTGDVSPGDLVVVP